MLSRRPRASMLGLSYISLVFMSRIPLRGFTGTIIRVTNIVPGARLLLPLSPLLPQRRAPVLPPANERTTKRRYPLPPSPARDASKAPRSRPRTERPSPGSRDDRRFVLSCQRSLSRPVSRRLSTAPACQRGLPATPKNHFLVSQAVRSAPHTDPKRLPFSLSPRSDINTLLHLCM
jgi:hypothetical protein